MKHIFIICTRNRKNELINILSSIQNMLMKPYSILVVDSSDYKVDFNEFSIFKSLNIDYYHTKIKGLTSQRNLALKMVTESPNYVHFFDDDVLLPEDYLNKISAFTLSHPNVIGGSPLVNYRQLFFAKLVLLLRKYFGIRIEGRIIFGGFNIGVYNNYSYLEVEWLPGCAMFFKYENLLDLLFDESRTGYGLGEDVDFTYRLSKNGTLAVTNSSNITHLLSVTNRYSVARHLAADCVNREKIIKLKESSCPRFELLFSNIVILFYFFLRSFLSPKIYFYKLISFFRIMIKF